MTIMEKHMNICKTNDMNFGLALEALKQGKRVARAGWNGKGQFLYLVKAANFSNMGDHVFSDVIAIKTTVGVVQVGWLASQTDMLCEDWSIVE